MSIENLSEKHQEIRISDRKKLTVTCVSDVASFDENAITVKTDYGMLAVDGRELRILSLSTDTGVLDIEGVIGGVVFFGDEAEPKKRKGIFGR